MPVNIKTPKSGGGKGARLVWDAGFGARMSAKLNRAQAYIDSEALRFCSDRVPVETGELKASGSAKDGVVEYAAPYAAQAYFSAKGEGAMRGPQWFERGKISEKERIRKGVRLAIRGS